MSKQSINDEFWGWGWPQSHDKFMTLTQSSVSKYDIVGQYLDVEEQQWNHQQFNKKSQTKLRNKINAKNSRDRKKIQYEQMVKKIIDLENQNQKLKNQKFCKWCRRSYQDFIINCSKNQCMEEQKDTKNDQLLGRQILEFQKPDIIRKDKHVGKIWIALALLMLILGLQIHGFQGGQENYKGIDRITLSKKQSDSWYKQYSQKLSSKQQQYFSIKMKFHDTYKYPQDPKLKSKKKVLIIEEEQQNIEKDILNDRIINKEQNIQEQQFKIHKEFIYSLQAEIADIGRYL